LHRLSAANFSADKPFTDAALQKIHKQSNGWPGRINKLAHNLLIETLPTAGINFGGSSKNKVLRLSAIVAGILIIGSLIYFQDEFNAWVKPDTAGNKNLPATIAQTVEKQTPVDQPAAPTPDPDQTGEPSLAETFQSDFAAEVYGGAETDTLITKASTPNEDETATPAEEPTTQVAETQATEHQVADKNIAVDSTPPASTSDSVATAGTETQAMPASAAKKQTAIAAAKASPIPADLPGFREEWIRSQNPEHYTLQLVAGNNLKTVRSFISQHTLDGPLAIYHTTRKGKPWFGLVQQSYSSKQAAIDARQQLPAALRKQKPWVRKFASLQKDLGKTP
jgi:DamX protein